MRDSVGKRRGRRLAPFFSSGSAVLFALFACVMALVSIQVMTAAVIIGERAVADERRGREDLAATDACLEVMDMKGLAEWTAHDWSSLRFGEAELMGRLVDEDAFEGWMLEAEVRHVPASALGATCAMLERGRDGVDLPMAAIVATRILSGAGRVEPWLVVAEGTGPAAIAAVYSESVEGEVLTQGPCAIQDAEQHWSLGEGWLAGLTTGAVAGQAVHVLEGTWGETVWPAEPYGAGSPDHPVAWVAVGGCRLDMSGLGDVWGVVVSDEGSLCLDGTTVHGAVYAGEDVDLGVSGQVVYEEDVWRWARDRSLRRVRLVPGSRREGTG